MTLRLRLRTAVRDRTFVTNFMTTTDRELEVKFYLLDPGGFEGRLERFGALCVQSRVHEHNLRFDTPNQEFHREQRVLRLRRDTEAWLTYKGPSEDRDEVHVREEIEFQVSDFEAAQRLLTALGYQIQMIYEKYRTTYAMESVLVTLDEMPFGYFAEIEGPDAEAIHAAADHLGLDWEARVKSSYSELFERVRTNLGLSFRDLTFENFRDLSVTYQALEVRPADH